MNRVFNDYNAAKNKHKIALVTGSSGFIGGHLVDKLRNLGYFVIGADIEPPAYVQPDQFFHFDLRKQSLCEGIFFETQIDEVYNLAAMMGGMGFIGDEKAHAHEIMTGSTQIVANILDCCVRYKVKKVFYASSACVYNMNLQVNTDAPALKEEDAYPAHPDLIYGWQKLLGEQMHLAAAKSEGLNVKIARFHNVFGPNGVYSGGKEKAPAALARKVVMAKPGEDIEVWGSGEQQRSFLYIDDCITGILKLMASDFSGPVNIGSDERVTINELASMLISISERQLGIKNVESGNIGVHSRCSDNTLIEKMLGWKPQTPLHKGLYKLYNWIHYDLKQRGWRRTTD